jgi:hypothetical protein
VSADNLDIVVTPPPTPPASDRLQRLADELRDQETSHTDTGADQPLADLLAAFRTVAVADSLCPGCESGQVTASRLASIDEVLAATESHRRRQQHEQALRASLDTELRRIDSADLSWTSPDEYKNSRPSATADFYNATIREANALTAEWNAAIDVLRARLRDVETPPAADVVQSVATSLRSLHDLHNRIRDVAARAEGLRRALQAELTAEAPDAEWVQATYHLTHAEQLAATIHDRRRNAERATAYRGAAHTLKKRLQCVIDKRFQELATPINDWLTRLAPDHTPQIQVVTKGTPGRAALQIHVEGGKVAAIGRLSDSQLDMLGLAAHLATLERETPGHPVFIDDPTDMLDHPTREKLASEAISRLLGHHNDIPGRQVVVLTHDHHLVRLLWHHHGHNTPRTLQAVIETDRTGEVCEAVITPRSSDQYLTRVDTLLQNHPDETNRIWLRNAVGNLTRQALELIVKDVLVVVGKHGHNYLNDNDPPTTDDTLGVGKAFERLEKVLERVAERQRECGSPRHRSALLLIDKLTDATARRKDWTKPATRMPCIPPRRTSRPMPSPFESWLRV